MYWRVHYARSLSMILLALTLGLHIRWTFYADKMASSNHHLQMSSIVVHGEVSPISTGLQTLSTYDHSIPRIIHHIWFKGFKTILVKNEPTLLKSSCLEMNCIGSSGGWSSMHWDEDNIRTLTTWPLIKHLWDKTEETNPRKFSDIARLAILWEYGGVYLDSDVACFKPFDMLLETPSLQGANFIGGQEDNGPGKDGLLINGIVFAARRHPFLEWMLLAFQKRELPGSDWITTGPVAWGQELAAFSKARPEFATQIKILPSMVLCPLRIDGSVPSNFSTDPVWTINFYPSTSNVPYNESYERLKQTATFPRCHELSPDRHIRDVLNPQERMYIEINRPQEDKLVAKEKIRTTPW